MKIININDIYILENDSGKYVCRDFLNNKEIDDYDCYEFDKKSLIFNNHVYKINYSNLIKFNDKNTILRRNQCKYKILKMQLKEEYILLVFSNNEERIFCSHGINLKDAILNVNEIILENGASLSANFLYNNSILIRTNYEYIPPITKIINIDNNTIFCIFKNGERRIFDTTRYNNAGIKVDDSSFEEIYEFGREV